MDGSEPTKERQPPAEHLVQSEESVKPENLGEGTREFYVPATFQFSSKPGRVERILVGKFRERGDMQVRMLTEDDEMPEFYTPAMIPVSTGAGRIERFLDKLFGKRGRQEFRTVPEEFQSDFYMPATLRDATRKKG